ncbi:hypothetical protein [Gehongia tenuis]|uniref:Uncharacterized protein n=1 Tax=Gehongia tenuis TaxID=2763655 RepID=A0A926D2Y8_9FIRM|nr:hypothetical protein [Gehongia tenuis]MBC8530566.1 hypothetical protein [Gehongia tenuis]
MGYRDLTALFTDEADIFRRKAGSAGPFTTADTLEKVAEGIPCRLSQKGRVNLGESGLGEVYNAANFRLKLFLPPGTDIRQGDSVKVRRFGGDGATQFLAGFPFTYDSHVEVHLSFIGKA